MLINTKIYILRSITTKDIFHKLEDENKLKPSQNPNYYIDPSTLGADETFWKELKRIIL